MWVFDDECGRPRSQNAHRLRRIGPDHTSELVSNAVIHAATWFRLVIRYDGRRVLTEVLDGDPRLVAPADEPTEIGGRGLFVVEPLSDRWGSEVVGDGKRVWAELVTRPRCIAAEVAVSRQGERSSSGPGACR